MNLRPFNAAYVDQCKGKMSLLTIRGYVITKLLNQQLIPKARSKH